MQDQTRNTGTNKMLMPDKVFCLYLEILILATKSAEAAMQLSEQICSLLPLGWSPGEAAPGERLPPLPLQLLIAL